MTGLGSRGCIESCLGQLSDRSGLEAEEDLELVPQEGVRSFLAHLEMAKCCLLTEKAQKGTKRGREARAKDKRHMFRGEGGRRKLRNFYLLRKQARWWWCSLSSLSLFLSSFLPLLSLCLYACSTEKR